MMLSAEIYIIDFIADADVSAETETIGTDVPCIETYIGKDIERRVLTRAVRAHLEHRVITSGCRTIVFSV